MPLLFWDPHPLQPCLQASSASWSVDLLAFSPLNSASAAAMRMKLIAVRKLCLDFGKSGVIAVVASGSRHRSTCDWRSLVHGLFFARRVLVLWLSVTCVSSFCPFLMRSCSLLSLRPASRGRALLCFVWKPFGSDRLLRWPTSAVAAAARSTCRRSPVHLKVRLPSAPRDGVPSRTRSF